MLYVLLKEYIICQFLFTPRRDGECSDELLELDWAILVLVKHTKYKRRKLGWVSVGEELRVDLDEALLGE